MYKNASSLPLVDVHSPKTFSNLFLLISIFSLPLFLSENYALALLKLLPVLCKDMPSSATFTT